jgi:hypothetical protein
MIDNKVTTYGHEGEKTLEDVKIGELFTFVSTALSGVRPGDVFARLFSDEGVLIVTLRDFGSTWRFGGDHDEALDPYYLRNHIVAVLPAGARVTIEVPA